MGFLNNLTKAAFNIATTPIAIIKDVVELDTSNTEEKVDDIIENITDSIDDLI